MNDAHDAHDDDVWSGVANERTHLAWNRTALALGVVGAAVLKGLAPRGAADVMVGAGLLAMAAVVWLAGGVRYREIRSALERGSSVVSARGILLISAGTSFAALLALAIALLPARG